MNRKTTKINKIVALFVLSFCFLLSWPLEKILAASIYLAPASSSVKVGSNFNLSVYVSSPDESVNAISGSLSFNKDKLEVVSVATGGSIFNFWVKEPSYSNASGSISFEGLILNPGYQGKTGKIFSITFKAKNSGATSVSWSSSSILANDGFGTNILKGTGASNINVIGNEPVEKQETETVKKEEVNSQPVKTEATTKSVPKIPVVYSSTHPDQSQWYQSNNPRFSWTLPSGVTKIKTLLDKNQYSSPTIINNSGSRKSYYDIADGVWFFHLQYGNENGWSDTAHYKVQIDSKKPTSFNIEMIADQSLPVKLLFNAFDDLSGVDRYEISIDGSSVATWRDDGSKTFKINDLTPGKHLLAAKVYDRAGNFLTSLYEFKTDALEKRVEPANKNTFKVASAPKERFSLSAYLTKNHNLIVAYIKVLLIFFMAFYVALLFVKYKPWEKCANKFKNKAQIFFESYIELRNEINEHLDAINRAKKRRDLTKEEVQIVRNINKKIKEINEKIK